MDPNLGTIYRMKAAESRSITAGNPTGEKGGGATEVAGPDSAARELGRGWKVRPCRTTRLPTWTASSTRSTIRSRRSRKTRSRSTPRGDGEDPTICGTGTEDYFGGAWAFGRDFTAPYLGFEQVRGSSGEAGARMTMYRFHIADPVYFASDLRVTLQALGWRGEGRFLPLEDDIASVADSYQTLPGASPGPIADRNAREII